MAEELTLDLKELRHLHSMAKRPRTLDLLSSEIRNLEKMTMDHEEEEDSRSRRIIADITHSLISQMDPSLSVSLRPHHFSLLHTRLQHLFHSFHTPTHPPYALMIRRAIMELNERNGSTEEAISEFVKKEYTDLPWAHGKILALHLEKLCRVGELACGEGGRYMLVLDGEETEQCKDSGKRKRGKRSNHGGGERNRDSGLLHEGGIEGEINGVSNDEPSRVLECTQETHTQPTGRVEVSQKEQLEVVGEQSQHAQAEAPGPTELEDSQVQMRSMSSNWSLLRQGIPKGKLDKNPISMDSELKPPKRPRGRPCKSEFPRDDGLHNMQKPYIIKMEKQHQYSLGRGGRRPGRGQGRCGQGRGGGRPPKLNQNQIDNQWGADMKRRSS